MPLIKLGIIGFGQHMVSKLLPAIKNSAIPHQLIAGCRRTQLQETQHQYNLKMMTSNYKDVLSNPDVNTVIIALPDLKLQHQVTREAILHNKHVFVEKPAAPDVESYLELIELQNQFKVKTCEGFNMVCVPTVAKINSELQRGIVKNLEINCSVLNRDNIGTLGDSVDNGIRFAFIHAISVANHLCGYPDELETKFRCNDSVNYRVNAILKYKDGINLTLNFDNQSRIGFEFKLNYETVVGEQVKINTTEKIKEGYNEKQLSYTHIINQFFTSINTDSLCLTNFENNIGIHRLLDMIELRTANLVKIKQENNSLIHSSQTLMASRSPRSEEFQPANKLEEEAITHHNEFK